MIKNFERYHGLALSRLLHATGLEIGIRAITDSGNSSYVLNGRIGLYVKYSTKRLSPWQFSFNREHLKEVFLLKRQTKELAVVLVCGNDGIAALTFAEFELVLGQQFNEVGWIAVSRRKAHMYGIKGSAGELPYKVADNECPSKVLFFSHINQKQMNGN